MPKSTIRLDVTRAKFLEYVQSKITALELRAAINKGAPKSATGEDGIPYTVLQMLEMPALHAIYSARSKPLLS